MGWTQIHRLTFGVFVGVAGLFVLGLSGLSTSQAGQEATRDGSPASAESGGGSQAVNLPEGYIAEAPLPEGFPPPSEVGKVVEKQYPLARTYSATGNGAFWICFAYLKTHKHEMTAPVIMNEPKDFPTPAKGFPYGMERMHFVMEKPTMGEVKKDRFIKVADMPAMTVLSIAYQGDLTGEKMNQLEKELRKTLAERPDLVAAGPIRYLGYNSPGIPASKRYSEIQLPVKRAPESTR
ncbi:SOUL heme-binding protein [Planctomycetes bacterium Pan216]|uniref:SOUL heme-binding protein n=1 Tax=Kolteria novifilia TaxID=2527975 RepID=A0A518B8T3_9BACT|nr:SOUL heme-binding protein [Planctomycetes bacterium Pan216]